VIFFKDFSDPAYTLSDKAGLGLEIEHGKSQISWDMKRWVLKEVRFEKGEF